MSLSSPSWILLLAVFSSLQGAAADTMSAGRSEFERRCAGCHGAGGNGGERAPAIRHSDRTASPEAIRDVIRKGIPDANMPGFEIPEEQLAPLVAFVRSRVMPAAETSLDGDPAAGERFFFGAGGCSGCHMRAGRGALRGPDLTEVARVRTLAEIEQSLLNPQVRRVPGYQVVSVRLRDGRTMRGFARNQTNYDLQLQSFDGGIESLRSDQIASVSREDKSAMPALHASAEQTRDLLAYLINPAELQPAPLTEAGLPFSRVAVPKAGDWPGYNGMLSGNRYSSLDKIDAANVSRLAPRWIFHVAGSSKLEMTPVVVDGTMYVTAANEAFALDAASGREIWHFQHPRTKGVIGDAGGGINRGVAVLGDRVFLVTDHAHLLALHRATGGLVWDIVMADFRQHYGSTSAPLVIGDLVIAGVSGGDEGARGFLAAYRVSTGERVWQFWTVPLPGERLSETWQGRALEHGCVTTWLTGSYDPESKLLYWNTGNPCPDYNGDERKGDNLYSDSTLAIEPSSGSLKWFFQYTPHDLHDWDAVQTPVLVDANFHGRPRKLLVQANRNGFFYVLDRVSGEFLAATEFVTQLTWASGIGKDGRPILRGGAEPTVAGVKACPAVEGATNWMSPSYSSSTGLFYVMALEKCNIYGKSSAWWRPGESFYGGSTRDIPNEPGKKYLRALDLQTGRIAWELPQEGAARSWGGTLATASGLVFFCDDSGAFAAVDARNGKPLWHFQTNQEWKASPMTYLADGKQFVAVAAGSDVLAFGVE